MRKAVICDIDGTLALFGDKNPYQRDFENDKLNTPVAELVKTWPGPILYVSGRDGSAFHKTAEWLDKNGLPYGELFMRLAGDRRMDAIVKQEILFENILQKYEPEDIAFVLDDRQQVVDFWRSHGFACFQVAPSPD